LIAITLFEEAGDLYGQSSINNNLGNCYVQLGNLDKALHYFEAGLKIDERIGYLTALVVKHNNIGEVLLIQGHLEEAVSHLQEVVATYERTGNPIAVTGLALVNLSRAHQKQQHYEKAMEHLQYGIKLLQKARAPTLLTEAYLQEAELRLETDHIDSALRICQQTLKKVRQMNIKLLEARGLRILGRIDLARGLYEQAEANIQQSIILTQSLNADYERGLSLLYLAELYGKYNNKKNYRYRGQLNLRQATDIFHQIGAKRELAYANTIKTSLWS
jgi:tetratricopeptide (TPR) repeat protein